MKNTLAIIYDFDLTLAPFGMQDFGLFQKLKVTEDEFMKDVRTFAKENNADFLLSFMLNIINTAKRNRVKITKEFLNSTGKNAVYFNGVESWFDRINKFGKMHGVDIEHYIISAGNREILEGTSIFKKFKRVYACEFLYDKKGQPYWPRLVVNHTLKTQYLFRIRKNLLDDLYNDKHINDKFEEDEQLPFSQMIYLGDGDTDIPCMQIVTNGGGLSLSVYDEHNRKKKHFAEDLLEDKRVGAFVKADYTEGGELDKTIKKQILKVSRSIKRKIKK